MGETKPNCHKCKHFYVTWDKNFPKGCTFYGFKTKKLPSTSVQEASGGKCLAFEPKPITKKFSSGND